MKTIMIACLIAAAQPALAAGKPDWVDGTSAQYPRASYIVGVGMADERGGCGGIQPRWQASCALPRALDRIEQRGEDVERSAVRLIAVSGFAPLSI